MASDFNRRDLISICFTGFFIFVTLTQVDLCLSLSPAVSGDLLNIDMKQATLLHRRSTRASSNGENNNPGNGSKWIPVPHPKLGRALDRPFYPQRPVHLHPQQHHFPHNNFQRPVHTQFHPHPPPPRLQITRPSQPEPPQPQSNQLYAPPSSNEIPSPGYLPASEVMLNNPSESELRFLFHRPEDENLIKSTILNESQKYNERVSFVRGPTLKFQRKQTIYLPPKKKSVIYIMLKEPQVHTDLEVIEPAYDPTPEVNIVYEKPGGVRTKHYHFTADKPHYGNFNNEGYGNHNHLRDEVDLRSSGSEVKSVKIPFTSTTASDTSTTLKPQPNKRHTDSHRLQSSTTTSSSNPCTPSYIKRLTSRKR